MENPIYSGFFTSTGTSVQINFRPGAQFMNVYNYTAVSTPTANAYQFYWQNSPAGPNSTPGNGIQWTNQAAPVVTATPSTYFTWFDSGIITVGGQQALTGITAANPPVVTTAAALPAIGSIVRFSNLTSGGGVGNGQRQIGGLDFTVTASGGGTFSIGNMSLLNSTATTAGFWRLISNDPEFYPRQRSISWITQSGVGATSPVPTGVTRIYTTVTHGYQVGQKINLSLPGGTAVWGPYAALDNLVVTIVNVNKPRNAALGEPNNGWVAAGIGLDNNFDVAVDTTGFGAWNQFPYSAPGGTQSYLANTNFPQGPAICIPFGEDSAFVINANPPQPYPAIQTANVLGDSLDNTAKTGIILGGGNLTPGGNAGPAGAAGDLMQWTLFSTFDSSPFTVPPMTA